MSAAWDFKNCSHGTAIADECLACERLLLEERVRWAEKYLSSARHQLAMLSAAPAAGAERSGEDKS